MKSGRDTIYKHIHGLEFFEIAHAELNHIGASDTVLTAVLNAVLNAVLTASPQSKITEISICT